MCEQNIVAHMSVEAAPRPRYHVGATKSLFSGANFDSIEEAVAEASRLAIEGYDLITIRDNQSDEWSI